MNYLEAFHPIKGFLFDVDGVFTNNELLIMENGEMLRSLSARDGFAVKLALQAGYFVGIITGGKSQGVIRRFEGLGVQCIYAGIENKKVAFLEIIEKYQLDPKELMYMGDDLLDYEVLQSVGLAAAPADAVPEVLSIANYVANLKGGAGCVREVIEKCLKVQGKWPKLGE